MNEHEFEPRLEETLRAGLHEWASAPRTPEHVRQHVAAIGERYVAEAAERRARLARHRTPFGAAWAGRARAFGALATVGVVVAVVVSVLALRGTQFPGIDRGATSSAAPTRTPGMTQNVPGGTPAPADGSVHIGGFMDADHAYVVKSDGSARTLLVSSDAGATWTVRGKLPGEAEEARFADVQHGWAIDSVVSGTAWTIRVWRTDDGGETWHSAALDSRVLDAGSSPWLSIEFFDATRGRAEIATMVRTGQVTENRAFENCVVYGTSDGGVSWSKGAATPCTSPEGTWVNAGTMLVIDDSAAPATLVTVDGGASWKRATLPGIPAGLDFGARLYEATAPWHLRLAGILTPKVSGPADQPFLVYESADGGASWTLAYRSPAGFDSRIGTVASVGPDRWYALETVRGSPDLVRLLETRDAGRSWSAIPIESVRSGDVTYFPGQDSGLMPGPMSWAGERHGMLESVYMDCRDTTRECQGAGAVFVTSDGGHNWTQVPR